MEKHLLSFFVKSALEVGVSLTPTQLYLFASYYQILHLWNEKINLFAPVAPEEFIVRHFVDSIAVRPFLKDKTGTMLDIGSGGGLPALPLGLVADISKIVLVESLRKKTSFLREAAARLGLSNIAVINARAKTLADAHQQCYDVIISRATLKMADLLSVSAPLLALNGIIIAMKGTNFAEEMDAAKEVCQRMNLTCTACHDYLLPTSQNQRHLIVFSNAVTS